jgi:hypothetical protein
MPLSAGMAVKNLSNASSPPAEAPIPTIGNDPRFLDVLSVVVILRNPFFISMVTLSILDQARQPA